MLGKNIFEDIDIDAVLIQMEVDRMADMLIEQYGGTLDEIDVLQMANNTSNTPQALICKALIERIKARCIVDPEFIDRSPSL